MAMPELRFGTKVVEKVGRDFVEDGDNRTSVYSRVRAFDFMLGGAKIWLALALAITGEEVRIGTPEIFTFYWSTTTWMAVLISLGLIRWVALIINGRLRQSWSAVVRSGTAFIGALFWVGLVGFLLWGGDELEAAFFMILVPAEMYCTIRAWKEAALIRVQKRKRILRAAGVRPAT